MRYGSPYNDDDLIRIKQHIQRPKDRESLMQLLAIQRVTEEGRGGEKPE